MPAKKKGGRPPKTGQGLWSKPEESAVMPRPEDGIDTTEDLDQEQREKFAKLIAEEMSLEERAKQLVKLAKLTNDKTAGVGLRAIQEINAIVGIHDHKPQEVSPLFVLPDGSEVAVAVRIPKK